MTIQFKCHCVYAILVRGLSHIRPITTDLQLIKVPHYIKNLFYGTTSHDDDLNVMLHVTCLYQLIWLNNIIAKVSNSCESQINEFESALLKFTELNV